MLNAFDLDDTIVAIASARITGAYRGIVRASGPGVLNAFAKSFFPERELFDLKTSSVVCGEYQCGSLHNRVNVKALVWPSTQSYTKQPSVEIHTIGSIPVLDGILQEMILSGCRLAEPGEFTMRAFLSGRLDLTEAEAVLGVIDASDKSQLNVALAQLSGGLANPLNHIRNDLIAILAHLEAGLDFVEDDIEFISSRELLDRLSQLEILFQLVAKQIVDRSDASALAQVVLVGSPNVGKSSLFNALALRPATETRLTQADPDTKSELFSDRGNQNDVSKDAIVSPISGTTRDYVTRKIRHLDVEWQLIDTAGIDNEPVELGALQQGQLNSKKLSEQATVEIFCLDVSRPLTQWEQAYLKTGSTNRIICLTKCDQNRKIQTDDFPNSVETSAVKQVGLDQLKTEVSGLMGQTGASETVVGTGARCSNSVSLASAALENAMNLTRNQLGDELVAAEIRTALYEMGKVTGAVYTDDILDVVFGQFCIGK